ncbi:hypothetical protein L1987_42653 [Smallanthus sonchifolius]|uniref:Uncharacterized protein n=1 Tax=Smallanthus sonchifolius TaxID=185202 RepID=A0ACB9GJ72_9ASTR|nr:hypothetical protein L1987_42653 [Smallanthus sonchifolius]
MGNFHIFADIVRFKRDDSVPITGKKTQNPIQQKWESNFVQLGSDCMILGKMIEVTSIPNLYRICAKEGFEEVEIRRACILTRQKSFLMEDIKVEVEGQVFDVHVKEFSSWTTSFLKVNTLPDEEGSDILVLDSAREMEVHSEDPFAIYEANSQVGEVGRVGLASYDTSNPLEPRGFEKAKNSSTSEKGVEVSSKHKGVGSTSWSGGSMINEVSKIIDIRKVMGFDMEGCAGDLNKMINKISENVVDQ